MKVAILLSTYNGERFLRQQLESIQNQDFKDFKVYCRDDGSTDATCQIIDDFCRRDARFSWYSGAENLGAAQSFLELLERTDAEYYFFADQDDIWFPQKLTVMLAEWQKIFSEQDEELPCVLFSDLTVVDENLNVIDNSFWQYNRFPVGLLDKNVQYFNVFNAAPGCAMLFNKALKEKISVHRVPEILMHDWYLILLAARYGKVRRMHEPLVLYRQHQQNVLGAQKQQLLKKVQKLITSFTDILEQQKKVYRFTSSVQPLSYSRYIWLKLKFNIIRFYTL